VLTPRIRTALIALVASAGLSACTSFGPYGGVGVGVGSGYGSYGYDPYYSGYGYGSPYYGSYYPSYYGWNDGFYYPGSGYWVYDPDGNQHPITDKQKNYWASMLQKARQANGTLQVKENWTAFRRPAATASTTNSTATSTSVEPRREALRQRVIERQQAQQLARSERQQVQQQVRSERQEARSERQEIRQQSSGDDSSEARRSHRRPR
jgi:hypothetical protein